jgi:hypothetical protein
MTDRIADTSQQNAVKIAGIAFLFILAGYILSWVFVYSRLFVPGDATAPAGNIMASQLLFRIGIASDLLMCIAGIVLAVSLYIILRPVNRDLALFALAFKLADAVLIAVTVLFSFIALEMLAGQTYLTVVKPEQVQDLIGLYLSLHAAAAVVPMVFTSLGLIVFFYLFYTSKYVPGILAGFGILSYALLLLYSFITILGVKLAAVHLGAFDIIWFAPSILFELAIGLWLLLKGVTIRQGAEHE